MKKKICIVGGYAPSIINFRKDLIIELLKKSEVYVCVPFFSLALTLEIESLGAHVIDIKLKTNSIGPASNILYMLCLFKVFRKIKPTHILTYTIKPVIWGSFAAKLAGIKNINAMITGLGYSFTDTSSFKRQMIHRVVCVLYKLTLSVNNTVFFQNHDDQVLFCNKKIIKNTKSVVIPGSGVNLEYFYNSPSYPKKITFLMIGRLLKDKGIYEYIEAAKKIKAIYPNVDFNLVGWIDSNPSSVSSNELAEWNSTGAINFLGYQEDVRASLGSASVFVLPSYREGMPRSVLEAMSMGRPVITTDAPGCRDTVIHGENGFLVPVKDVNSLVVSMQKFIENPAIIAIFGKKSREMAVSKYDVRIVNDQIISEIYI